MSSDTCGSGDCINDLAIMMSAVEVFREENPQLNDLWHEKLSLERKAHELQIQCNFFDGLFNSERWQKLVITKRELREKKEEYEVTYKLLYDPENPPKRKIVRL